MAEIDKSPKFGEQSQSYLNVEDDETIKNNSDKPEKPTLESLNTEHVVYRNGNGNRNNSNPNESFDIIELPQTSKEEMNGRLADPITEILVPLKSLDANRYATKKTIAQGMLDIALLTANASQLKYILQVGKQHEFYTLMLTLICLSIGLQIAQGLVCLLLGSTYNINKEKDHKTANMWNNVVLTMMLLTVTVNIIISVFELHEYPASDNPKL